MDERTETQRLLEWYDAYARPFLTGRVSDEKLAEFDKDRRRLEKAAAISATELAACFLGTSGIGKSTLINALVGGAQSVVPSGGVGPLTAQALVVRYSEVPGFEVEYHGRDRILRTVFGLQQMFRSELGRSQTESDDVMADPELDDDELPQGSDAGSNSEDEAGEGSSESEKDRRDRRDQLRRRAQLMVTGIQDEDRDLPYLLDSLRDAIGIERIWGTEPDARDAECISGIRRALVLAKQGNRFRVEGSVDHGNMFRANLRDHATGYLAPLIKNLELRWHSPLLSKGARSLICLVSA